MKIILSLFSHYQRYGGAVAFLDLDSLTGNAFIVPGSVAAQSRYLVDQTDHTGFKGTNGLHGLDYHDGKIYCCQWSRVLVISPDLGEWPVRNAYIENVIDNNDFNDLHDLKVCDNHIYVAASGSETGFVLDLCGNELRKFVLHDRQDVKDWLAKTGLTLNQIASTKPHPLHLNTFVKHNSKFYATVLETGMILEFEDGNYQNSMKPVITGLVDPHDCYFLPISNDVVVVNNSSTGELQGYSMATPEPEVVFNVQLPKFPDNSCWTRGIAQIDDHRLLVGLSVHRNSPFYYWPGVALVNISTERVEAVYQFHVDFEKAFTGESRQPYVAQLQSVPVTLQETASRHLQLRSRNYLQLIKGKVFSAKPSFRNVNIYSIALMDD